MAENAKIERILRLYPDECRPHTIELFAAPLSFSGAGLWRIASDRGPLCLRRWPAGHPSQQRLEFIQAVLWHVDQEGFHQVALPLETQHHHGYVWHEGHLWELLPWLPGAANYRAQPSPRKLEAAMVALARFHQAAATFPLPETNPVASPGMDERLARIRELLGGGAAELASTIESGGWPEMAVRAGRLLSLFAAVAPKLLPTIESATRLRVSLQPCIRDVWHAHILFEGEGVSGIVDFGSLRPENVAADVARLLGSLAMDDRADWDRGMAAYATVGRLSADELSLVSAFDRSTVLLGGMQWMQWIFVEGRQFGDPKAALSRVDEFVTRLGRLHEIVGG